MKRKVDLVSGNIIKTLIALSLPILGTSFIQMAYSLVDMIWIGKAGSAAVAAVGIVVKKPDQFGKAMLFPAMVETYAILALLVSILAVNGIKL